MAAADIPSELATLLKACTVAVEGADRGTGFFVAPMTVVTCLHVVRDAPRLAVRWQDEQFVAALEEQHELAELDLAILRISSEKPLTHPWAPLGESWSLGGRAYAYGFSDLRPAGEPVLLTIEGSTGDERLLKLAGGQLRPGMSGSPLLDLSSGKVCGVVRKTRDRATDLGGFAIPATALLANERIYRQQARGIDRRWAVLGRRLQPGDPALARLADTVRLYWIDEYLHTSLGGREAIALTFERDDTRVTRPIRRILPSAPAEEKGRSARIADVFHDAHGSLLLLGQPGAGKTISLIHLAQLLLDEADADAAAGIPIIVNLANWQPRRTIRTWLIEEAQLTYHYPRRFLTRYLAQMKLIVLFDGLDEVPLERRDACITALNSFLRESGARSVVCCRSAAYDEAAVKLELNGAIEILPLTIEAIRAHLAEEQEAKRVRELLDADPVLLELARTPLMLNIILRTHPAPAPSDASSVEERRARLFDAYIETMHAQHGDEARFPRAEMDRRLSRLARSMKETSQSVFQMENLQPTWLPAKRQQREYIVLTRVAFWLAAVYPLTLHGLAVWLAGGMFSAALDLPLQPAARPSRLRGFAIGSGLFVVGLLFMTVVAYFGSMESPIDAGVFFAIFLVVIRLQTRRRGIGHDIRTFERLGWSWRAAVRTAAISGGVAAALLLLIFLITDFVQSGSVNMLDLAEGALAIGGMIFCGVFVFAGWSRTALAGKSRPNEGMRMTLKNALVVAGAITSVFIIVLTAGLLGGEYLTDEPWPVTAADVPLGIGAFFDFLSVPLLLAGGNDVLRHYILRLLLNRYDVLPLRLRPFLDHGTRLGALQRIGGSYLFAHRLLLEHFAARAA